MRNLLTVFTLVPISFCAVSSELSPAGQMLIDQIKSGGPASVRQAAQVIERSGERDIRVLDVLAENLLQNYKISNNTNIDAMAWACKGLAASGNKRYYTAIKEVADSDEHKKLRKHCERAADDLDSAEGEQYVKGMVSLTTTTVETPTASTTKPAPNNGPSPSGTFSSIQEVKIGMSMEQAYAIAGAPSSTISYETGKRWQPFNFKGGDVSRTAALYKGQGRIVFSNNSAYSGGMSVIEVQLDANEKGYP